MNYINIFTIIWVGVTFFGGLYFLYLDKKLNWSEEKIKTIATSFGILGTFIGIVVALYSFDTSNISESIPSLLDGLKTAFSTSIAGLLISLLASFKEKFSESEGNTSSGQFVSLDEQILEEIKSLNKNIIGDGDSSLNSQIGKLRQDNTDNLKGIKTSFDNFAEQMTSSNIDALAEAIEKVMGEFNTTINDKLGETFDNFRSSVENLSNWQSEYKEQISTHIQQIKETKDAVESMDTSILSMKESYENIQNLSRDFEDLIKSLNNQLSGSVEFSKAMADISDDLEGSGKMIKDEVKDIMMGVTNELEDTMRKTLTMFGENLASISGKMADDFERVQEALSRSNN
jgi:DNA anti-recombination protein RmuC